MRRAVEVNVTGIHSRPGEPTEKVITTSMGHYEDMEDGCSLLEYDEEQNTSDGQFTVHNKVEISADGRSMDITRGGSMRSKISFGEGMECKTDYNTPYGSMPMKVKTKSFDYLKIHQEDVIKVVAEYVLELDEEVLSDSMIIIEIKNAET